MTKLVLLFGAVLIGAVVLVAGGVKHSPTPTDPGHFRFTLDSAGKCEGPVMAIMHGKMTGTTTPEQYYALRAVAAKCGGKMVELDSDGRPKG